MPEPVTGWAARKPHPVLRGLITRYIGYRQDNVTLDVHRGLPSRHLTLIISLDRPIRLLGMPEPGDGALNLQAMVGGMHTVPALIAQDRSQTGMHIELNPLGARALLGMPSAELTGQVVGLAELGSPELVCLPERLAAAPDWPSRFALLDRVLGARVLRAPDVPVPGRADEVTWAWRRMIAAAGQVRVAELAGEVGWSRRHFGERFRGELGLAPKQAARVLRFERAGAMLRAGGRIDLAAVALACGYSDQSHLSNEWRALAGCSPGRWIAEELPFLQDEPLEPDAESLA